MIRSLLAAVAGGFDEVVRGLDVGGLVGQEFTDGEREFLVERVGVGLLGDVLALLGRLQQAVIAAAELVLEFTPAAMKGATDASLLLDVVDTFLVENGFEVAAETGAGQGFFEKATFQGWIFEFIADFLKTFLTVDEAFDDGAEGIFNFHESFRCC